MTRRVPRPRTVTQWIVVAVVAYVVLSAALVLLARQRALAGLRTLEQARATLTPADLLAGEGEAELRRAEEHFDAAQRFVGAFPLAPVRALPVIGRQVRSFDALAGAARDTASIGRDALAEARATVGDELPSGAARVALMASLADIAGRAADRLDAVPLGPSRALIGPIDRARRRLVTELDGVVDGLRRTETAVIGLGRVLEGPSNYLLLAANNAEMRAGSGMFLSLGVVTMQGGSVSVSDVRSVGDVDVPAGVPITDEDFEARWGYTEPNREWRNLGLSPRFDVTAELASRMWVAAGEVPVDGVLAVDVVALQSLLRATGPVDVEGTSVTADNVLQLLLHDQYAGADIEDPQTLRRERLSAVATAVIGRLEGAAADVAVLADELRLAAAGRHVLAWSPDGGIDAGWAAAGVSGTLRAESMLVTLLNRGSNKLDQFVEVSAELDVAEDDDGTLVTVTVTMANRATLDDFPYVIGTGASGVPPGDYPGFLLLEIPRVATGIEIDEGAPAVAGGDGETSRVMAARIVVPHGETVVRTLRFRLPEGFPELRVEPSARAPAIAWTGPDGLVWSDASGSRTLTL